MSAHKNSADGLFLPGVEMDEAPGVYRDLIEAARARGGEYPRIWDLFAFRESLTTHLARFTQGVLRSPSSLSPGFRELIAAYTSYQNQCAFCTQAHAAAASELLGSEMLVWAVLSDPETTALPEREKVMLRFVGKVTKTLSAIDRTDIHRLHDAGWDDEAIYFAVTTCALFNFYNRWITATGVPAMSSEAHRQQGRGLAAHGYVRD
jgi:uncharacterized peroxidase-related enzyme